MISARRLLVSAGHRRASTTAANGTSVRRHNLAMICGDGIGHEVVPAAQRVLEALNGAGNTAEYTFEALPAGFEVFQKGGHALPPQTLAALQQPGRFSGAIFGAVSSPSHKVPGYQSPIVAMRRQLDLYANVRPVSHPGRDIDMLILRENTECLYVRQEHEQAHDPATGGRRATATRVITEYASRRIGTMAAEMALKRQQARGNGDRPAKLTIVHKANVLAITDGLFRETVLNVLASDKRYKDIQVEEQLVDSMVYRLYREPQMFDVVVAPNMYGDIISDAAAALVGSLGLVPGANVGDSFVMGEPVHGSAPDIAGKNRANPIACIRSAALLLQYLGETKDASRISAAVDAVMLLDNGSLLTPDVAGGRGTCSSLTDAIIERL